VVIGAFVGGALGMLYGTSIVRQACAQPNASNLCGFINTPSVPFYIVLGAIIGASAAALSVAVILRTRGA